MTGGKTGNRSVGQVQRYDEASIRTVATEEGGSGRFMGESRVAAEKGRGRRKGRGGRLWGCKVQGGRDGLTMGPDTARPKRGWKATGTPGGIGVHSSSSELERGCPDAFMIYLCDRH